MREAEKKEFLARLERDARGVLGSTAAARIAHHVAMFATLNRDDFATKVVEDVQQEILDTHAHTAWPPCPAHSTHPLWFDGGAWRCPIDAEVVVALGELAP